MRPENAQRQRHKQLLLPLLMAGVPAACVALMLLFTDGATPGPTKTPHAEEKISKASPAATQIYAGRAASGSGSEQSGNGYLAQFAAQLKLLQNAENSNERVMGMQALLESVSVEQIPAALQLLKETEPIASVRELEALLTRRWAETNPRAAAAYALQLPAGESRQEALNQVALAWVTSEKAGAAQWAAGLPLAEERQQAVTLIASEMVRSDPQEAVRLAIDLPPHAQRDELLSRAVAEWTNKDCFAAIAWAREIPDETLRDKVLAGGLTAWANQDPMAAAMIAMTELHSPRVQADTVVGIAQRWAQQDPEATASWVRRLPSAEFQQTVALNIMAIWEQELGSKATP